MSLETIIMLVAVGVVSGAVSALAGGSALISFPVLLAVGLPPVTANATNFATVLPGNIGALAAYRSELSGHRLAAIRLCLISLAGGAIGCILLLNTSNEAFLDLVPWLLLTATLLIAFKRVINNGIAQFSRSARGHQAIRYAGFVLIFVFAIYGGFFGAGLGIIMLSGLMIAGYTNYHEANALKNLSNASIAALGVVIYTVNGLISWPHAIALMAGSTIGGYSAVRISRFIPQSALSNAMVIFGLVLSAYYFWR